MPLVEVQWSRLAEELFDLIYTLESPTLQPFGGGLADDEIVSSQWHEAKEQTAVVAAFIPQPPDIPDCSFADRVELKRLRGELQRLRDTFLMDGDEPFYMPPGELGQFAKALRRFFDDNRDQAGASLQPYLIGEGGLRLARYMPSQPTHRLRVVGVEGESSEGESRSIVLTADQRAVLEYLGKNQGVSLTQENLLDRLKNQRVFLTERTLRSILKYLRDHGLAHRPHGPKKGDAISKAGISFLEK